MYAWLSGFELYSHNNNGIEAQNIPYFEILVLYLKILKHTSNYNIGYAIKTI